jgi:hypothetical protein
MSHKPSQEAFVENPYDHVVDSEEGKMVKTHPVGFEESPHITTKARKFGNQRPGSAHIGMAQRRRKIK